MPMFQRARIRADIEENLFLLKKDLIKQVKASDDQTNRLIEAIGQQFNHMQNYGDENFCFELSKLGIDKDDFGSISLRLSELEKELDSLNQNESLKNRSKS